MKALKNFIYNTIIGGIFFLLPIFVIIMVVKKLWLFFQDLGNNLIKILGLKQFTDPLSTSAVSAVVFLLVCFICGLLAKWSMAGIARNWFETSLKRIFPFYDYYKTLIEQKLKIQEDQTARPVVLVRCTGGWRAGIVVDEYKNGEKVVFFPFSPKTTDGEVCLAAPEDIRTSSLDERTLNIVLLKQGKGLGK